MEFLVAPSSLNGRTSCVAFGRKRRSRTKHMFDPTKQEFLIVFEKLENSSRKTFVDPPRPSYISHFPTEHTFYRNRTRVLFPFKFPSRTPVRCPAELSTALSTGCPQLINRKVLPYPQLVHKKCYLIHKLST